MTVVPDDASLCNCWPKATEEERAADGPRNRSTFSLRGLRSCPKCRGKGWYLSWPVAGKPFDQWEIIDATEFYRRMAERRALADAAQPADGG